MNWIALTFAMTFAASVVLTVAVRAVARHAGVVDHPDGKRKLHPGPVARWGGVGVYLALVLGLLAASCGTFGIDGHFAELGLVLTVAAGIVCLCGAIDDCWSLNSKLKLLMQLVAVMPIIGFGYWIELITVFGIPIHLGWFGVPLTIVWLVGCINSLNLLDGMDGLASMVGALTAAMIAVVATSLGHDHVSVIALVLAAALCGFLVHNLPPATVFLGDSGSMAIGLCLGVLGMQGALKTSTTLAISIPAVIMSLPLLDTALAIIRRKLTGRSFACADREHIHHRLLDRGLTPWQALSILGALSLTTGAAATAAVIFRNESVAWITAAALLVIVVRFKLFGHHELALVKHALAGMLVAAVRSLGMSVSLDRKETPVVGALSFDEAWHALVERSQPFHAANVQVRVVDGDDCLRRYGWSAPGAARHGQSWRLALHMASDDAICCELAVEGRPGQPLEATDATELLRTLHVFGEHFLHTADELPAISAEWPTSISKAA